MSSNGITQKKVAVTYKLVSVELLSETSDYRVIYRSISQLPQNHNLIIHVPILPEHLLSWGWESQINQNFGLDG